MQVFLTRFSMFLRRRNERKICNVLNRAQTFPVATQILCVFLSFSCNLHIMRCACFSPFLERWPACAHSSKKNFYRKNQGAFVLVFHGCSARWIPPNFFNCQWNKTILFWYFLPKKNGRLRNRRADIHERTNNNPSNKR